jgi:TPR repeat protein
MYRKGQGVEKDAVQAVHWYRKAAVQGHAQAKRNLGVMYGRGDGVKKDV